MKVEQNLPIVRERKLAILKGDPELCAQQKKAGKLLSVCKRSFPTPILMPFMLLP